MVGERKNETAPNGVPNVPERVPAKDVFTPPYIPIRLSAAWPPKNEFANV
jgi:hypothetical protein